MVPHQPGFDPGSLAMKGGQSTLLRRLVISGGLALLLIGLLSGTAFAADGSSTIVSRFWDSLVSMFSNRMQEQVPGVTQVLQQAEQVFLGQTDDLSLNPAVQDVFNGMRVAGLLLLAFCTVISLVELTEASITGSGGGLIAWFKRFLVATLLTFGGLQFYAIWIRLFNGLLALFRGYLDTHWTDTASPSVTLYEKVLHFASLNNMPLLTALFAVLTLLTLLVLWFLIGGVRQAELILSMIIAPIVWPLYLIPSIDDIPKTAFRGFLGLNATLLFVVAMLRLAVRLAVAPDFGVNFWNLVPAISLLMMSLFLPATIKRIVGQGHSGAGALVTAVQMAAGIKFLSMGLGATGAAVSPPAAAALPGAPVGASAYPLATAMQGDATAAPPGGGLAGMETPTVYRRARIGSALPAGSAAMSPAALEEPFRASQADIDLRESKPGSGEFDVVAAIRARKEGEQAYQRNWKVFDPEKGGEK